MWGGGDGKEGVFAGWDFWSVAGIGEIFGIILGRVGETPGADGRGDGSTANSADRSSFGSSRNSRFMHKSDLARLFRHEISMRKNPSNAQAELVEMSV
jgi:hypothetical protein